MDKLLVEKLKRELETGPTQVLAEALLAIYEQQTVAERHIGSTIEHNGRGFSGRDAEILTSFANWWKAKGWFSPKQIAVLRKKMPRYAGQLLRLADEKAAEVASEVEKAKSEIDFSLHKTFSMELSEIDFFDGDYFHFENGATVNFEEMVPFTNNEGEVTHWELHVDGGNSYIVYND